MKTLIIGGTGIVGSSVVQRLLHWGGDVRCLNRSPGRPRNLPKNAEAATADINRPVTLPPVFEGADALFLFLPISRNETEHGVTVVQAARKSTIKRIVYVSAFMPAGSEAINRFRSSIEIERAVRESGMAFTILRPNHFFQSDLPMRPMIMGHGVYPLPIGSVGLSRVDVRDVADAAVNALNHSGHEGQIYALHGPDPLTGRETASIYSEYLGSEVRYAGDDLKAWERQVKNLLPGWLYRDLRELYRYYQKHGMVAPHSDLIRQYSIVGHNPRSFRAFAEETAGEWRSSMVHAA